jgi:5-methylcytosine-specific restriction endonuclease McrA
MIGRKARRAALVEAQNGLCFYCDIPMTLLRGPRMSTIDHIISIDDGGDPDDPDNQVAACHQCNRMKGCLSVAEIRQLADRIEAAINARQ